MTDARLSSPAALRNREPIFEVLKDYLGPQARVLELASGTGEHALYMTQRRPGWVWQPTDISEPALASIEAWRESLTDGRDNLLAAQRRDVLSEWPEQQFDAMVAVNLIHISPWVVTAALMEKAALHLATGGVLLLYGPYRLHGEHTAPSNVAFDEDLKRRNPEWGIRDLEAVTELAASAGLSREGLHSLPANNLALVFRRG
ncbi:DUF938 domain-containing protein [Halomonas sp. DP8Y7-1]|uniref:DUF938 domain-containing protein n=1 Tax=Halomonas sp. DP8Y7-1 TaxID=2859078 RepID=UPI001C96D6B6|nr:DUF938 domain-containing protein [Halomonas sp. DP8Y7-1]MBY6030420.1 DUF938 domain-containing protein [Halomonas sp. DP8Y7-1]